MDNEESIDNLNETKLKRILINLERRYHDNQKLRIKHSESPSKFAASETELFAVLDELQSVATQPELYQVLITKKCIPLLVSLLSHENTDISAKVIGMFQEFTDIDTAGDQDSTEALICALRDANLIDLLVSNLSRLNENIREESTAINNSLAILDNLIDFDPTFASVGSEPLIDWMLKQLKKASKFNSIKLAIAELLSILLITSADNKSYLGSMGGIDVLLQQVAYYRRVAPVTGDEHEYLEQIINCLCTAMLDCDQNRESFIEEEGVDLIELILREKRETVKKSNIKAGVLRLFNHVLTTDKNQDPFVTKCCEKFIQVLGLRVLFPIFMNPKLVLSEKIKKREYHQAIDEIEEHTAAILLAMLKYCQDSVLIQRILIKFAECNFEKLNRLVELHVKYFSLSSTNQHSDEEEAGQDNEESGSSGVYFTLRTIDYIILLACYLSNHFETYDPNSGETFTNRVDKLLASKPELRHQIVFEVRKHIEEVADSSPAEKDSLELLIKYFEGQANKKGHNQ